MSDSFLKLVSDKKPARKSEHSVMECRVCREDTGHAGTTFIQAKRMPLLNRGRIVGGSKTHACLDCLARGKVTLLP